MKKNNYLRQILLAVVMFVNISAFAITFKVDGIYYSVDILTNITTASNICRK